MYVLRTHINRTLKRWNIKESIKTTHFSIKINKDNQRASKKIHRMRISYQSKHSSIFDNKNELLLI